MDASVGCASRRMRIRSDTRRFGATAKVMTAAPKAAAGRVAAHEVLPGFAMAIGRPALARPPCRQPAEAFSFSNAK